MAGGRPALAGVAVLDNVGRVPGFVNSYTFLGGEETYLIDTGLSRKARSIVRAFRASHVPLDRVRKILLTHHHPDHRGGAAYLLQNTRALLACHSDDAPFVDGRTKPPMSPLMRLFLRVRPASVALPLKDGDRVGPLVVIHLPGHTPGAVAFYEPVGKLLFSGDSVVEHNGRLTLPAARFAANLEQAVRSLDRLRTIDVEVLLPGHGVPVVKNVAPLLDELIRRAPADYLGRASP